MKIHRVKLHKVALVCTESQLAGSRFSDSARNNFKKIVEDSELTFDNIVEKLDEVIQSSGCEHTDYPREASLTNIPISLVEELAKLNLPSIYITLSIQYSDGTEDNDIVVWDDLNGVKKDVIEQMSKKESISIKQKVSAYDKKYEEQYMV